MTPTQIELARHALGLPNKQRKSYRNHFVTGPGCDDYVQWMEMVQQGHAKRRDGSQLSGGDPVFWLTVTGAALAMKRGEKIDPEDFPPALKLGQTPALVEDDKQAREKERIANDLCQWCEGYTVKEIFSEALQEYANLCLRENLIRSVEIAAEKDERIESLSAQVATASDYIVECSNGVIGGGDEPVRFLIASHATLAAQVAELKKDAERMEWLDRVMFEGKWDGTIGRPKSWHMAGPYRHELMKMRGASLREAIDAAKESGVSP